MPLSSSPFEIYIHAPWCKRRCPYCDFTVFIEKNPPFVQWKQGILRDWLWFSQYFTGKANTIYFGGGTPSLIPVPILAELIEKLPHLGKEITIEINPGTITPQTLEEYLQIGINRVSLGIQSFQPEFERLLGRGDTIAQARDIIAAVQDLPFQSWSLDLMFGLPNQTMKQLQCDLEEIFAIRPPHISIYGLTYKKGTPFEIARNNGKLKPISEERWLDMFDEITSQATAAGYQRYEVSNFKLGQHSAQHNESIWLHHHYAGLGPSAHGFLPDGTRTIQSSNWNEWRQATEPFLEVSTPEQLAIDFILTRIRHQAGFSLSELKKKGFTLKQDTIKWLQNTQLIMAGPQQIQLAPNGWVLVDSITQKLIDSLIEIQQ